MTDPASVDTLALARRIADLARERRASDVVLLDVRDLVDYTDFFLIASGTSARQNLAIAEHVVKTLKAERRYAISKAGLDTGSWICLDLGDVVVHVFDPETRVRYDLELLWADAPRVDVVPPAPAAEPAEAAPVPKKRRRSTRKAAVPDADAENAPESERPPEGEPEPEKAPAKPARAGGAKGPRAPKSAAPRARRPAKGGRSRRPKADPG